MLGKKEHNGTGAYSNQYDFSNDTEAYADLESHDTETRSRLRAVLLYEKGHSVDCVVAETGCSRSSLLQWYRAYRLHGPEGLYDRRQGGNNAKLTDKQISDLGERLRSRTPQDILGQKTATPDGQLWTVEDLHNVIWQWYGVRYKSRSSYYDLLKKCAPRNWQDEIDGNGNHKGV